MCLLVFTLLPFAQQPLRVRINFWLEVSELICAVLSLRAAFIPRHLAFVALSEVIIAWKKFVF